VRFCRDRFSATGDSRDTGVSGARRARIQVHCISVPFIVNYFQASHTR
jgi:hypothetical protein